VAQPRPAVRAHHDQIDLLVDGGVEDRALGVADADGQPGVQLRQPAVADQRFEVGPPRREQFLDGRHGRHRGITASGTVNDKS